MMIPHTVTAKQADIACLYWGCDWTFLSAGQVQEALDWWYGDGAELAAAVGGVLDLGDVTNPSRESAA